jgi:Zn-dependent M28 family amino/carboxypeptidase
MHWSKAWLILCCGTLAAADFSGAAALEFTRQAVAFGPRPPGSPAIEKLRAMIKRDLAADHCEIQTDSFTTQTPSGPVLMENVIAKFPGTTGRAIVITGHYDTKPDPANHFVGANDGGSSTGFLLELAEVLPAVQHSDDIFVVWLDGEEAYGQWSETDSTYGSRHLAAKWEREGILPKVLALINVDMIGDKDLGLLADTNSSPALRSTFWRTAKQLGYGRYFLNAGDAMDDDHMPFQRRGVNVIDLIDFDYGPNNQYWHTDQDTMDKLAANSFDVVGKVVIAVLRKLESRSS